MSAIGPDASMSRARRIALAVVVVMAALSTWAALRLQVVTDIRHFIPSEADRKLSDVSGALAASSLTRTSVMVVQGPKAVASAKHLSAELRAHPEIEWVRSGIDAELESTLRETYLPRRAYMARPTQGLDEDALRAEAADLKRALGGPKGPLLRALAPSDPLLLFTEFLTGLREGGGGQLATKDGQFIVGDGAAAVLFVRTKSSAFSSEPQAALQADLHAIMQEIQAEIDPDAVLSQSGLAKFSIAIESSTRADVTRVSVVSTVSIIVMFLLLFGQLRAIVVTFAPVVLGVGGGVLACTLLVQEVHGLTLAFGSALLGVGVDYAVHLMFHLSHPGSRTPSQVVAWVRPGLTLGAATTVVGLGGLALTTFPGMRELALFGAVGITGSLVVTVLVVPAFFTALPPRSLRTRLIAWSERTLDGVEARAARAWVFFVVVVLVGAAGLVPLQWSDGLRALYDPPAAVLAEDTRVRELTGAVDKSRAVLANGSDLQEALARNDAVHAALQRSHRAGELEGYRSVHPWLPAVATQQENLARFQSPAFAKAFEAGFAAEGFRPGVFGAFFEELAKPTAEPLVLADLEGTSVWPVVSPFVVELEDRVVVVTWLRGDLSAPLRDELDAMEGVQRFDQQEFLDRAYGRYRIEMIEMLTAGLAAVFVLIFLRYRQVRPTIAAFLPALAGAMGVVGVAGWVDGTANLVHGASLLLVCSIGADYGVFMVESRNDRAERGVTMASTLMAGLTTVLSFGLLAMSDNPALASVGRSIVVGVLCALVTAPVAATLRRDGERS